jgi:hypothetical protein
MFSGTSGTCPIRALIRTWQRKQETVRSVRMFTK